MQLRALITGINGQDGSYLSEYLLSLGYMVYGTVRRNSVSQNQSSRINHINHLIHTDYADINDISSLINILKISEPHEIYHLAAQSHVHISFKTPQYTIQTNTIGTLNLLEAVRILNLKPKIYNAASSEMFGNTGNLETLNEQSQMRPVSPYAISKLGAYHLCKNYKASYDMFISNGILFNHESPRRGSNFVTQKVVQAAKRIKEGKQDKLELGNLDSSRDWGHASDYVRAMHLMLQQDKPDNFVISTGITKTVRELCQFVFSELGLDWSKYVVISDKYKRPEELKRLVGNSFHAHTVLNWKPEYTFEDTLRDMING